MKGILYLLPVPLGELAPEKVIPVYALNLLNLIDHYVVEDLRSARRYLKKAGISKAVDEIMFHLLNEHTLEKELIPLVKLLKSGKSLGIMSEAGVPAVADPGAKLVELAHRNDIPVVPLAGPSSILMGLMASGMNGQCFYFHGYLPIQGKHRIKYLKIIEKQALGTGCTQIFMETPYRNMSLLRDIMKACHKQTSLCIAAEITLPGEYIKTKTVGEWRNKLPDLHKRPAVFLIGPAG